LCLPLREVDVNSKTTWVLCALALVAGAAAGAAWYQAAAELRQIRLSELRPIAALLKEDQNILLALQTDSALEKDSGILASYLSRIRADGVAKHADMKQRLDQLAENNSAIVALVNLYSPRAKTASFSTEADKFQRYAIARRDRWNSIMELFMAGGNYPVAEMPFPKEFLNAVQAELEAAQRAF
jgi:hypothetical protein